MSDRDESGTMGGEENGMGGDEQWGWSWEGGMVTKKGVGDEKERG